MATARSLRIHARTGRHAIAIASARCNTTTAAISTTSGIEEPDGCTHEREHERREDREPALDATTDGREDDDAPQRVPRQHDRPERDDEREREPARADRADLRRRATAGTRRRRRVVSAAAVRTRLSTSVSWPTTTEIQCARKVVGVSSVRLVPGMPSAPIQPQPRLHAHDTQTERERAESGQPGEHGEPPVGGARCAPRRG